MRDQEKLLLHKSNEREWEIDKARQQKAEKSPFGQLAGACFGAKFGELVARNLVNCQRKGREKGRKKRGPHRGLAARGEGTHTAKAPEDGHRHRPVLSVTEATPATHEGLRVL